MHVAKRLAVLRIGLYEDPKLEEEGKDIHHVIAATMNISSDLQVSLFNVLEGIRRYLACLPETAALDGYDDTTACTRRARAYTRVYALG